MEDHWDRQVRGTVHRMGLVYRIHCLRESMYVCRRFQSYIPAFSSFHYYQLLIRTNTSSSHPVIGGKSSQSSQKLSCNRFMVSQVLPEFPDLLRDFQALLRLVFKKGYPNWISWGFRLVVLYWQLSLCRQLKILQITSQKMASALPPPYTLLPLMHLEASF